MADGKRVDGHLRQHQGAWHRAAGFGLQVVGNEGFWTRCDKEPLYYRKGRHGTHGQRDWVPLSSGGLNQTQDAKGTVQNHLAAIRDLVNCSQGDGEPKCGLAEGIRTVSFVSWFSSPIDWKASGWNFL